MVHADIDPRRCCGYRLCVDVAPDVFAINAAGKAETLVGDIPVGLVVAARAASHECPSAAITIRDADRQE
uniref:Putative ferredoxin n=1 Tax=Mycobacterium sp. CH-2 TaxID=332621 RepID=Q3Y538_9MYCO|nr:putative ferredoxin [Mycobacterium sp. CH-2]